jgi:hypothetical protein
MASTRSWFRKSLVEPDTVVSLPSPSPSKWKIIKQVNEIEHQVGEQTIRNGSRPSYAAVKLLCHDICHPARQAFMRIYQQIPFTGTDVESLNDRAKQATSYTHEELNALRSMTRMGSNITPQLLAWSEGQQNKSGLVPGGYITYLVWEIVPGLRLGDSMGADAFWGLPREQRDEVRVAFERGFGYFHASAFVENSDTLILTKA